MLSRPAAPQDKVHHVGAGGVRATGGDGAAVAAGGHGGAVRHRGARLRYRHLPGSQGQGLQRESVRQYVGEGMLKSGCFVYHDASQ